MKREHNTDIELPSGYRKVKCLVSDGHQWIDTGIRPKWNTETQAGFRYIGLSGWPKGGNLDMIGGVRQTADGITRYYPVSLNGSINNFRFVFGNSSPTKSVNGTAYHEVVFNDEEHNFYLDGVLVGTIPQQYSVPGSRTMWVFAANSESSAGSSTGAPWPAKLELYYYTIKEGEDVVADFVPCVREYDSKPGLYDIAGETFKTNIGTGEFTILV